MNINGKLEWTDYLQAQRLHMRQHPAIQVAQYVLVAIIVVVVGGNLVFSLLGGDLASFWLALIPVVLVGGLLLLYFRAFLPGRIRRIYAQQKELSAPMEHEITAEGMATTNQYGHTNRPWGNFHKWKEDKNLLMLYVSDVAFVIIPKRFCSPAQIEAVRAHLLENKVPDASRFTRSSLLRIGLYVLLLLVILVTFYANFISPAR